MSPVLRCPLCKSHDVHQSIGYYDQEYTCKKCGYTGTLILDVPGTVNHQETPDLTAGSRKSAAHTTGLPKTVDSWQDTLTDGAVILLVCFILLALFGIFVLL
jgi:hypothetical protein